MMTIRRRQTGDSRPISQSVSCHDDDDDDDDDHDDYGVGGGVGGKKGPQCLSTADQ